LWLAGGLLLLAGGFAGYALFWPNSAIPNGEKRVVTISPGLNVYDIAAILERDGVIKSATRFVVASKVLRISGELKAGRYEISAEEASTLKLLDILHKGRIAYVRVTIPEGFTARRIASLLAEHLHADSVQFMQVVNDTDFCRQLGVPGPSLEGFLFPDTYFFTWGQKEEELARKMVQHFFEMVPDSVIEAGRKRGLDLLQLVTLASIIQGEAMVESEMPIISAVYHNRLKRGMLLQADPTLQYIIPDGPRRLTNADKEIDSPYNTYRYPGLPPGPINNPGLAAIRAAANPAPVNYLYFVANGDGTHTFSRTLREHLKAKRRLDALRRKIYGRKSRRGT